MIKKNLTNKKLLVHLKESNIFRFLDIGENINVSEDFDIYSKEKMTKENFKTLIKTKKIRI